MTLNNLADKIDILYLKIKENKKKYLLFFYLIFSNIFNLFFMFCGLDIPTLIHKLHNSSFFLIVAIIPLGIFNDCLILTIGVASIVEIIKNLPDILRKTYILEKGVIFILISFIILSTLIIIKTFFLLWLICIIPLFIVFLIVDI